MRRDTDSADRPVQTDQEVEITPEMIDAGVFVLASFEWDDPKAQIVEAIYREMREAQPRPQREGRRDPR